MGVRPTGNVLSFPVGGAARPGRGAPVTGNDFSTRLGEAVDEGRARTLAREGQAPFRVSDVVAPGRDPKADALAHAVLEAAARLLADKG